jgi:F-type H+-transporting ATPase subunit delta
LDSADHIVSGMAGRYATALFELAMEAGALDEVMADLDDLGAMLSDSADLVRLVRSPLYDRDDQARAMAAVLEAAGAGALVRQFVGLVAHNRRLFALADMIRGYRAMLARHRGEVSADVVSAAPLTAAQRKALSETLAERLGRAPRITERVDPAVLGGLVVRVGSRMIDTSLRTKLNNMRSAMNEVG